LEERKVDQQYRKIYENLSAEQKAKVQEEYKRAYDFDRRDPLFGLSRSELSGPKLSRRAFLRLLAASGAALPMRPLLAAAGIALPAAARVAAQAGGELVAGWAGAAEITTLDPAQINQVLQFQIASNVLSGLTHITPDLTAEGDLAVD
jgi:peptide/nickel transport system substrate-binding protein